MTFQKVAVLGSGVMGSGIAAQIANAGIPVVLLDIVPKDIEKGDDRSKIARGAIEKMKKADPAPFMSKAAPKLITPGNLEDDLELLKECDWIVEVVLENLEIKHATYKKIAPYLKKDAIVSSNTSSIPLEMLVEPMDDNFKKNFVITHFFNPPRYMRLLELVTGPKSDPKAIERVRDFCDIHLGKGVVVCHDTPGFIANRLGVFWLTKALNTALEQGTSIEEADAVMGKPVGIPKTGVFGLLDLIGIDLMPHLSKSLLSTLPKDDPYRAEFVDHALIHKMIEAGYTGRKGKGGFYRLNPDPAAGKEKQSLTLKSDGFSEDMYKKAGKPRLESVSAGKKGLKAVVETDDAGGKFAREVLFATLAYSAGLVPEIADNISDVDEAMRLGYNWKQGPFEMIDALGASWFASELEKDGKPVPDFLKKVGDGSFYKVEDGKTFYFGVDGKYHEIKRRDGVLLLSDIKLSSKPLVKTASASVWDIGDGVLCVEFTGKMNALDEEVFKAYERAIAMIGDGSGEYKAMVIYNEGSHFSAGANLGLAIFAMNIGLWPQIESLVAGGQKIYQTLKHAPFPVVSAPSGMALGGGCEILLHSDHVQAHAETYTGLVEVGVGLIPGWGGCKEMLLRYMAREEKAYDKRTGGKKLWFAPKNTPMGAVREVFQLIGTATVAKSAHEAKEYGYMKDTDAVTMNRDRLLHDAKEKALELAKDYTPPLVREDIRLPGPTGKAALDLAVADMAKSGKATPYDVVVSDHLATILTGGPNADWTVPMSEKDVLKLEVSEFLKLVRNEGTQARIEHMLTKGKPLRN
ncbi:MAG: 3-hydroxyacyl-CoA dehydrogenase NAD-binding domain-containing protein [Pseudobdellovibrionaceae bacterium]